MMGNAVRISGDDELANLPEILMLNPIRSFFSAALVLSLVLPLSAVAALKVEGKPKITFSAVGSPGFLDIDGVGSTVVAVDDGTTLTLTVPMNSVTTGISMRDEHMNEKFVEVGKYPNAVMKVAKADVKWPVALGETSSGTAKGTFNIHGADQPTNVLFTVAKTKTGFRVKAKFDFDCSASGIAIPSYLGISVDPKMKADVQIDLIDG